MLVKLLRDEQQSVRVRRNLFLTPYCLALLRFCNTRPHTLVFFSFIPYFFSSDYIVPGTLLHFLGGARRTRGSRF